MGERRGTKALELWCRRITEGYPGVNVQNMTTSWKDGLAFCAMIHHFRPDLIDFDSLDKNNVYENNELAFKIAEQHLGIPALLDAEDMASCSVPDRLSILTYLSQFYQTFGGSSPSRLAVNRTTETADEKIAPIPESPKEKATMRVGMRRDPCAVCGLPVFLAEKLVLAHVAYHRTCFRCARCSNQLTLGNFYETEEGQYCCETCPDEEVPSPTMQQCYNGKTSTFSESELDENVTDSSCKGSSNYEGNIDAQASQFNDNLVKKLEFDDTSVPDIIAQTSRLRLNFISNHLLAENGEETFVTTANSLMHNDFSNLTKDFANFKTETANSVVSKCSVDNEHEEKRKGAKERNLFASDSSKLDDSRTRKNTIEEEAGGNFVKAYGVSDGLSSSSSSEEESTANDIIRNKSVNLIAKANNVNEPLDHTDKPVDDENCLSIVQSRLRLFENTKHRFEKRRMSNECQSIEVLKCKARYKEQVVTEKDSKDSIIDLDATKTAKLDVSLNVSGSSTASNANDVLDSVNFGRLTSSKIDETIASEEDALEDGIKDFDTEQSGNSFDTTILSETSLLHRWEDSAVHTNKGNDEDRAAEEPDSSISITAAVPKEDYPEDLNPFKSDEEDSIVDKQSNRDLINPFESEGVKEQRMEERREVVLPKPAVRSNFDNSKVKLQSLMEIPTKRRLTAPQINLNPFWSDEDDQDSDLECKGNAPVPKPRTTRHIQDLNANGQKSDQYHGNVHVSNSSLTSLEAGTNFGATYRKKKPAPLPPNKKEQSHSEQHTSLDSPTSVVSSKARKAKPAPPPPLPASSSRNTPVDTAFNCEESPLIKSRDTSKRHNVWEDQKVNKDEANRNRQSFTHASYKESFHDRSYTDKSTEGKWKRKKGPAPPCPMPLKRKIKVMSLKDVKLELDEIEMQQQGLEKQGVRLEQLIRSKCESGSKPDDASLGTDVEELVLELFALVNEKNELFRRQAELMLLRRQQRLEEEHAEVEYQIRCLMSQQESTKTDFDKQREEVLIKRLVEIVERRNEIVDCLEMDRRREIEEDRSIHKHMDLFVAKNKSETSKKESDHFRGLKIKENKTKDKTKEKKLRKTLKKDIDKDIDEIELKLKRHNKRKWF